MTNASSTHTVHYDPKSLIDGELPLDREPFTLLTKAVLGQTEPGPPLRPCDYEQIALLLTGHAHALATDVRRHAAQLPEDHPRRALADIVLADAVRDLSLPLTGTARCAQDRAGTVRSLYERLDRFTRTARTCTG